MKIVAEETASDRFWRKVNVTSGCWNWVGSLDTKGYGTFAWKARRQSPYKAHRVSWILTFGEIPDGMFVCHHCDNPSCVRPSHLFLGTSQDNASDMVKKGRSTKGDRHPNYGKSGDEAFSGRRETRGACKLSDEQVVAMREMHANGASRKSLAAEFGVRPQNVWSIVTRRTWRHI